jgi:hypothetical protein
VATLAIDVALERRAVDHGGDGGLTAGLGGFVARQAR